MAKIIGDTTATTMKIDQTYNADSANAQSGKAVAEAIDSIQDDITVDQEYNEESTKAQSGKAVAEAIASKVDQVEGKGLSENDYTSSEKSKLEGISDGATAVGKSSSVFAAEIFNDYINNSASSAYSHAEGRSTTAYGVAAHAEGIDTIAKGQASHAEGDAVLIKSSHDFIEYSQGDKQETKEKTDKLYITQAEGQASHAEGRGTYAEGTSSHAEGNLTKASGSYSHAEGSALLEEEKDDNGNVINSKYTITKAEGQSSHAEGQGTYAQGNASHTEGRLTKTGKVASAAHAEGFQTEANGAYSHAEGQLSKARGTFSHAEGLGTEALGNSSHAEGRYTRATVDDQHVEGRYNFVDENNNRDYLHVAGNGSKNKRSNAYTLKWDGTATYAGDVYAKNDQRLATEGYVDDVFETKFSEKVDSTPEILNTLNELAETLGDDPNFATTIVTQLGEKANKEVVDELASEVTEAKTVDDIVYPSLKDAIEASAEHSFSRSQEYIDGILVDYEAVSWEIVNNLNAEGYPDVTNPSTSTFYLVPNNAGTGYDKYIWIEYTDDEGNTAYKWDVFGSATTMVVSSLYDISQPSEDVDYIVNNNDGCLYYKYINNEFVMVGGSTAQFLDGSEAESIEEFLKTISPNTFTDYYVLFNGVYSHYRYYQDEWICISGTLDIKSNIEEIQGNIDKLLTDVGVNKDSISRIQEDVQDILNNKTGGHNYNITFDEEKNELTLYCECGCNTKHTIEIAGGGGTGSNHSLRLINCMESSTFTTASSSKTVLSAKFLEYFGTEQTPDMGTLTVKYKLSTGTDEDWSLYEDPDKVPALVSQDEPFDVDVTDILSEGKTTYIELTIAGGESGMTRSLTYSVTQVEARIEDDNFNTTSTYEGNVEFRYKCFGRGLKKTVHFEIDGDEYAKVDVGTSHNSYLTQTLQMSGYSYGAHDLRVYFTVDDGTKDGAKSNVLRFTILYDDKTGKYDPMIGVIPFSENIIYGEPIDIYYIVDTPGQENTDELTITVYALDEKSGERIVYDSKPLTNISNNALHRFTGSEYPEIGDVHIEFKSGATTKTVRVRVDELITDFGDLKPVVTNLIYQYSAAGRSNNDINKEKYQYEYTDSNNNTATIEAVSNGFNWVSNGYIDGEALTLSGDATHTIKLPMFSTNYKDDYGNEVSFENTADSSVTTNGRTFEIEFSVSNVTDINAEIIKCMSDNHAGFVVTPQNCYMLYSNGENVDVDDSGFIKNEATIAAAYIKDNKRIRLTFVIEPKGNVKYKDSKTGEVLSSQCVNIYINGQFANSIPYADNANFYQTENITIGSDTCIIKVYDIRVYNRGLYTDEVMQNYKASPLSVQDRIIRFKDNDVLTDSDVDYNKAINKYPCLLITGSFAAYKDAPGIKEAKKTECGVTLTKPDGNGGHTTEFNLLDKDADGVYLSCNNVQGTSSVKFPVKNYKVYLAEAKENDDGTIEKKKVKYSLKGKNPTTGEDLSIGESTLCWKGDYMSSDHANTFNANLADTLFNDVLPSQDPNQKGDSRVQNTVYGFRCLLFNRENEDEDTPIKFIGDGALNNDKGNTKTFGLECDDDEGNDTLRQKWEFLNNTESLCMFQTDRFFEKIHTEDGDIYRVLAGLESTYPDQGDLEEKGLTPKYDHLQVLYTWVYQRANFWDASDDTLDTPYVYNGDEYYSEKAYRKAIFVNEFDKHFNRNHALVYYLFCEFVALCDNRAKNMFLRCEDVKCEKLRRMGGGEMKIKDAINMDTGEVYADMIDWEGSTFAVWICDLYDLDSCFGVENSGYLQIPYYADWNYSLNGAPKFNGYDSKLWLMFEKAFKEDIEKKAQELTAKGSGNGGLNYDALFDYHIRDNALLVCPTIVNEDMECKYINPWSEGFVDYSQDGNPRVYSSQYKYMQRGSRTEQKDAFIFRRCNMLYSKYKCSKFLNNNINFRCGVSGGLPIENAGVTIKASQVLYPAVKYGDGSTAIIVSADKTNAGTSVEIKKAGGDSDIVGYSDTIYIAGGTLLTDIGDISKFRPFEIQLQNATSLKRLIIGSTDTDYKNGNLSELDTKSCQLLEELNIMGCTNLPNVDLSNNRLIRKVHASRSGANFIKIPNGGVLEELHLGKVSDIEVLNQPKLAQFNCDGYDNLTSLRVENTPNIPVMEIIDNRLSGLNGIRLVGINETIEDTKVLEMLVSDDAKGKYINDKGEWSQDKTAYPYISGTIRCNAIGSCLKDDIKRVYPNLKIEANEVIQQYVIEFVNYDGSTLYKRYLTSGEEVNNPNIEPNRPGDNKYSTYQFDGWLNTSDGVIYGKNVNQLNTVEDSDITYKAQYIGTLREFTVTWYDGSGYTEEHKLKSTTVTYGSEAVWDFMPKPYGDGIPTKEPYTDDEGNTHFYLFKRWKLSTGYVTDNMTVDAEWTEVSGNPDDRSEDDADYLNNASWANLYRICTKPPEDINSYIKGGDRKEFRMGNDYSFANVEEVDIISESTYFDGTNAYEVDLCGDIDKSFTMCLDYEYINPSMGKTIMSIYDTDGKTSYCWFLYMGSDKHTLGLGGSIIDVCGWNYRNMIVVRHIKGEDKLYVYSFNPMLEPTSENPSYTDVKLVGELNFPRRKPSKLVLGGRKNNSGDGYTSQATGFIHKCKIWYDDLGDHVAKSICDWTTENVVIKVASSKSADGNDVTGRYQLSDDTSKTSSVSFMFEGLLTYGYRMNNIAINYSEEGKSGWHDTHMRKFLNPEHTDCANDEIYEGEMGRFYKGLPVQLRALIKRVNTYTNIGNASKNDSTNPVRSDNDYIYLPSSYEVGVYIGEPYIREGVYKNIFVDNSPIYKAKYLGRVVPENAEYYTDATDPTTLYEANTVKTGDVWKNNTAVYIYEDKDTREKFSRTADGTLLVEADDGGLWVRSSHWWERSPFVGNTNGFYYINTKGSHNIDDANVANGVCPCFSI